MIIELSKKQIEDIYNALYESRPIYNETFETFKKYCEDNGITFEKHSFDYFIKDEKHPYKPLNDKIVRDVVKIINKHVNYDFTYTTEMIEELTFDKLCRRFKIDELEMCGILIDIEQKFNVCLCLNDIMKLTYFRELIYKIEEVVQENNLPMYL
jgi:hypothetical protein